MTKAMRSAVVFFLVLLSVLSFVAAGISFAQETTAPDVSSAPVVAPLFPASDWIRETTYTDKISHKLGFGFLNLTAGWTAFFYEPAKDKNFFSGLGKGVLYFATNTVGGVLHAATFPVPVDIPLPHGGIAYEYSR